MPTHKRGVTVMLVLVFMGVFILIVGTISSYVFTQAKYGRAKYAREQALHLAEAGLEYYRWFLAHYPNNLTNGTGLPGPYVQNVSDPEGAGVGTYSLTVQGSTQCGVVQWVDISSQGKATIAPTFPRTLTARYMKPSVAEYSYILNANVWAGADRNIIGPYHSNGGIRMDGTNNSDVTSSVATWLCDASFGCSPTQTRNGVFGSGSGSAFWQYPVPTVDFAGMAINFSTLQTYAQTSGIYLNHSNSAGTDQRGWRIIFRSDNTIDAYRVTGTSGASSLHVDDLSQWYTDYHTITNQTYVGRYTIPSNCALIFVRGKTWIEGTVASKVTLVAADTGSFSPDIILNGNISYTTTDGSVGLTAIAERSVLYGLQIPDNMSVRGVFVAQNGYYGRNLYACTYSPYHIRNSLTVHGTVVSNGRVGTQWTYSGVSGCGSGATSGFLTRTDTYDRLLAFSPPPFTPSASQDYRFVLWREQ